MKTTLTNLIFLLLASVFLVGCGGNRATADEKDMAEIPVAATVEIIAGENSVEMKITSSVLTTDYPNGSNIRNQLAWGTLLLEDQPELAITQEQARQLLAPWQCLNELVWGGICPQTEQELITEIEMVMTAEQLQAIAAMKITRDDIQTLAEEWGLDPTMGDKVLSEKDLQELRAAKKATNEIGVGMELSQRMVELVTQRAN